MNIILFDTEDTRAPLYPFTFTRPIAAIRVGIFTIFEKWSERLKAQVSFKTSDYLEEKFPTIIKEENYLVDGRICPNSELVIALKKLGIGEALFQNGELLACKVDRQMAQGKFDSLTFNSQIEFTEELTVISQIWDIFMKNASEIGVDLAIIKSKRSSIGIQDPHTIVYGEENVFVEVGATIKAAIINAEKGPVYIGKNAVVNEGAIIIGAFALCEGSHINIGAKMRGDTTIGPFSKVGGEVSNSVIFGNSSKGHDGFLGNSVLGEWCNLGADTNTSNLKNDYSEIKIWSYAAGRFRKSGLQFCGLIMGDHSKSAINTMFNTGTVIGVNSNVFGPGFHRNFVPSFAWGGGHDFATYELKKANEVAKRVMNRRGKEFTDIDRNILEEVYLRTAQYRYWEK